MFRIYTIFISLLIFFKNCLNNRLNFEMKSVVLIIFILIFGFSINSIASKQIEKNSNFRLYDLDNTSDYNQVHEELKKKQYQCINGVSSSLDLKIIPFNKIFESVPVRLEKIIDMDKMLIKWNSEKAYFEGKEMRVLSCTKTSHGIFNQINSYYSNHTKRLLCFHLIFEDYDLVRNQLLQNYGEGALKNYWEKKNSLIFLYMKFEKWHLNILYENEIGKHYRIEALKSKKRRKEEREEIKSVFGKLNLFYFAYL